MAPPESAPERSAKMQRQKSKRPDSTLRLAQDWHVSTIPPKTSIKGKIVPGFLSHQRRRLSVEVYRFHDNSTKKTTKKKSAGDGPGYYEEAYIRLLNPQSSKAKKDSKKHHRDAKRGIVATDDSEVDFDDNVSLLDGGAGSVLEGGGIMSESMPMPDYDGWFAKYKLPLKAITFKGTHKKCVTFLFEYRTIKQTRKIYFDSEGDALDCANFIKMQQAEEDKRLRQKYSTNSSGIKVNPLEYYTFLVEIVGATDLPAGDLTSSDPYVVCYFNHKEVHRTKHIPKTLDPIWTLKTRSLFLLEVGAKELFQGDGLHLDVMEYDTVGKDEELGHAVLDPRSMFELNGQRCVLPVEGKDAKGELAIRVRQATPYDKQFLTEYYEAENSKKGNAALNEMLKNSNTNKGGKSAIASILGRNVKTEKHGMLPPVKKYRVRPGPDPEREEETQWLTMPDMEKEIMGESREWIDAGSGELGRLFVEVLECKGLPNLDSGGLVGNLTDSFCCLVFEDTWAQTDIIDDDLDPKWMPWTKRAFIFHMYHSSSELFIGVFDHDAVDDHDLIGRIAINVSNLQPDTQYDLTYNIYPSAKWSTRDIKGQIRIRLRMEIDDDRKLLLSCLEPPKTVYVNVKKKKDFKVLHQVCNGSIDMESYSLKTFFTYLDELQSYTGSILYLKEAIITLLFWRGHHEAIIGGKKYHLPLHSASAFLIGITLVEHPQMIPSFCFLSIAWVLIASMFFRRHHPNPWMHCKSFVDILLALLLGDSFPPATIHTHHNKEEVISYIDYWNAKAEHDALLASDAAKEAEDDAEEAERALDEIGDTNNDITTKKGRLIPVNVDPLRPYMEPFQAYLAIACRLIRYVRNIFLWEECYLAFWLTFGSLVLSVACLFVPWFFLIRWTSRIIVWTVFGPWMRAVDIYYYTPLENMTEEELLAAKVKRKELRKKYLAEAVEKARIERERSTKLKTMKKYLFGKFIMKVPVLKEDRYQDVPLPQSTAVPYSPKPLALAELAMKEAGYHRVRVPGQNLDGDMIPSMETRTFTEAPVGQATKKHAQSETDTAAYAKVGSIVAGAAVITYYGVPLASSVFSSIAG